MLLQALLPFLFLASVPLSRLLGPAGPWLVLPEVLVTFLVCDAWLAPAAIDPSPGRSWLYRLPLWLYAPAQLAVIFWGIVLASRTEQSSAFVGLALSTGLTAGIFGMLVAHDLFHSRARAERALGIALLCGVTYPHFRLSHIYFHHRIAGTRADPATARRGEGAYRFILRSIIGQLAQAWRFERDRAAASGRKLRGNRMYLYLGILAALYGAVAGGFGWRGLLFLLAQSLVAIFILELFNYIAHYGLERRVTADGKLEPMQPVHSWNAAQRFSNLALFNGGRHTHHHQAPMISYQHLTMPPEIRLLPSGFAGSICLALVPPLWRWIMDPRIDRWDGSFADLERRK